MNLVGLLGGLAWLLLGAWVLLAEWRIQMLQRRQGELERLNNAEPNPDILPFRSYD
jgi:hypothetical protein